MNCKSPEGVLEQEEEYITTLGNAAQYSVTDSKLEIYSSGNQKLLVFERIPEYSMNPADLVGTSWHLVSINGVPVLEDLSITLTFDSDSEASGRAGCIDYVLPYTASGDDIRWGMIAKRDIECSYSQTLNYTGIVMWGANYRITAEKLEIFTAKGDTLTYKPLGSSDGSSH